VRPAGPRAEAGGDAKRGVDFSVREIRLSLSSRVVSERVRNGCGSHIAYRISHIASRGTVGSAFAMPATRRRATTTTRDGVGVGVGEENKESSPSIPLAGVRRVAKGVRPRARAAGGQQPSDEDSNESDRTHGHGGASKKVGNRAVGRAGGRRKPRGGGSSGSDEGRRSEDGRVTIDGGRETPTDAPEDRRGLERRGVKEKKKQNSNASTGKESNSKESSDGELQLGERWTTVDVEDAYAAGERVCGIYGSRVDDQGYSEYLVRWVGKSHHKNSWVDGQTLELLNAEFVSDFTAVHGERSTVHLVQEAWLRPQRVVSVSGQPPDCQLFVKWWGLPYKDCTWEALNAHPDFEHLLAMYSKFGCESVDKAQTNQEATAEKKATKYNPCDIVAALSRWLRATWYECEGVCFVDNAVDCLHAEVAATFIAERKRMHNVKGPTLIIVKNSQLNHWAHEFNRIAPDVNMVEYDGSTTCRISVQRHEWAFGGGPSEEEMRQLSTPRFNVLLTTQQTAMLDIVLLRQVAWESVIVVENAQQFTAESSSLIARLNGLNVRHRVLMFRSADFTSLHMTLNILEFLKRSPTAMRNLETRLLNLSHEQAAVQTAALLAAVTMDSTFCGGALRNKSSMAGATPCMGTLHTARLLELSDIVLHRVAAQNGDSVTSSHEPIFPPSFDFTSSQYLSLLQQLQALHDMYSPQQVLLATGDMPRP